jgi:hypothetical protein
MDPLASLLNSFSLHAGDFYIGNVCGIHDLERNTQRGHLHLVHSGEFQVHGVTRQRFAVAEPTLVFLARPDQHRLVVDGWAVADVVCATVQFGGTFVNPITAPGACSRRRG